MDLTIHEPRPALDIESVTVFLAGCNTELKCIAMEGMEPGVPQTENGIFDSTLLGTAGSSLKVVRPNNLGNVLAKIPDALVAKERRADGKRLFIQTEMGRLACGLGGHLLHLSEQSSRPIRTWVGENTGQVGSSEKMSNFEARLIVLTVLHRLASGRWRQTGTLLGAMQDLGLQPHAAQTHLKKLRGISLVESTSFRREGKFMTKNRLRAKDNYYPPSDLVANYLRIIGRFAVLDNELLTEGYAHLRRICHDEQQIGSLVKRSYAGSSHTKR